MDNAAHQTLPFRTLTGVGEATLEVERSRFLAEARPVTSEAEALERVAAIRREHHDARHVVYGLRVGHPPLLLDRFNDDGEPTRTGGYPAWQLMEGEDLRDALVVVVRYYGGIKLGTGGLSRAYRDAAREALERAGRRTVHPEAHHQLTLPYGLVDSLHHLVDHDETLRIVDTRYAAEVTVALAVRRAGLDAARERLGTLLQRHPDGVFDDDDGADNQHGGG